MTNELQEIVESLRGYVMSEEEKRQQLISFAYGNVHLHNPSVTRADVEKAVESLDKQP